MKDDNVTRRSRLGEPVDDPPLRLFVALLAALTTAAVLTLGSADPTLAQPNTCGNGTLDAGEDCDLSSPSGAFCPMGQVCTASCDCAFVATTTLHTTTAPTTSLPPTTTTVVSPTSTTSTTLLNHFQCYEAKKASITAGPVSVQDQFGTATVSLSKPNRLCAPTNKRNEDPTAPTDPDHLKAWQDKHSAAKVLNQTVVNQFGTVVVDVLNPAFLLVPASKSLTATPPPLVGPTVDHFQCYKVKRSQGTPKFTKISGVAAADQFGSYTVDLVRPRWLCAPANKAGEDPTAPSHVQHLLCYKTRNTARFTRRTAFTTDQFGSQQLELLRRIELCVPSVKNPGVTTTSTVVPTTTTSSTGPITTTTTHLAPTSTTSIVTTSTVTTTSSTTTTLYGSPSRAFMDPVRSLLE
jgi:hypothetical protein